MLGGGGSGHDLGYFADYTALTTAHATATAGDFAVLGSTDTMWVWDGATSAWVDTNKSPSIATGTEVIAGTDNTKMVTALAIRNAGIITSSATIVKTADFNITSAENGKTLSNYGATTDIKGTLAPDLPDGFRVRVVNEVGGGDVDSYTKLMLHLNNNATDSSASNHPPTATDMTYTSTAGEFKFGYAGVFNGTSSKITYADSTDFNLGLSGNPFTLSFWIKIPTDGTYSIIGRFGSTHDWNPITGISYMLVYQIGTGTGAGLNFYYNKNGSAVNIAPELSSALIANNAWHHVAVVYNGTTTKMAVDGVFSGITSNDAYYKTTNSTDIELGRNNGGSWLNAKLDELVISTGVARWAITTNFTPPNYEYYQGSTITLSPPSGGRLPNTSAINRNLVSFALGDSLGIYKTADNFIGESVFPDADNWADTAQP